MANHPNRSRGPYTATLSGDGWASGPTLQVNTVREARAWAEEHGDLADCCIITDARGNLVARHQRNRSGGGWFRAAVRRDA